MHPVPCGERGSTSLLPVPSPRTAVALKVNKAEIRQVSHSLQACNLVNLSIVCIRRGRYVHLKSCSRRAAGHRTDASITCFKYGSPFLLLLRPQFFPAHLPLSPPGGRRSIANRSIRALRVTSGSRRHEIFYVTGRARANLSNNKMDSHVSPPPPPPPPCMLRVNLTSENLIRHGEKNRPISGLQIVRIFFYFSK